MSLNPVDTFIGWGWSPVQSAGIVGNLWGESALNPMAVGDGGSAFGLAQWHPDRQRMFQSVMGVPIQQSSFMQQLQFVNWELNNTEKRAGNLLRGETTLSGATYSFMKNYERPADSSSFGSRLRAAGQALADGKGLLEAGRKLLSNPGAQAIANSILPGSGTVMQGLGMIGDCDWICQIKEWIKETAIFQRLAIAVLAFIVLLAAFYLMKPSVISQAVRKATT